MLRELSIRNFAIIDDLRIQFSDGLTILSGETGAGKSILINAVNLLLGSRASATLIRTGCEAAELEALFQISPDSSPAAAMTANGYASDEGLVIRRIVSRTDNNRIYVNGRLATMQLLNTITEDLASISGQHAHQSLLREDQHLLILDEFGALLPHRRAVATAFHELLPQLEKLEELKALKNRQAQQMEFLQFQRQEIDDVAPTPNEDAELEQERARLRNSELLYQTVYQTVGALYGDQGAVAEKLAELHKNIEKAGRIDTGLLPRVEQLADISFQLEDLVEELRNYLKTVQMDPGRLDTVEERRDHLNRLKRKYGGSLDAVMARRDTIIRELAAVQSVDEEIAATQEKVAALHARLVELSTKLSQKRQKTATILAEKVEAELAGLKMPHTQFEVVLRSVPADANVSRHLQAGGRQIFESGFERATFMIAPNVGEARKALASIASGGELSRIVLALKAILAATDAVETIIFDEVDAGIGGGTAEVVGRKLAELARRHQVICITHLPQIAKFGRQHFNISKQIVKGRTITTIQLLNQKARIDEIARMLGGDVITPATLTHAREMLQKRTRSEK